MKIGGHGAYSNSGDIEDQELGYGAQIGAQVNETLSLEVSGTLFEDFDGELEITTVAATARLGGTMAEGVHMYLGGGASYNMFDYEAFEDPDDEVGYHACGGVEFVMGENVEIFGEYRYTWVDIEDYDEEYEFGLVRVGLNFVLQ
jgi:opacity protein-like surface antigen